MVLWYATYVVKKQSSSRDWSTRNDRHEIIRQSLNFPSKASPLNATHFLCLSKSCIKVIKGIHRNCISFGGYVLLDVLDVLKSPSFESSSHFMEEKTVSWHEVR
jgi:hypothetical protein